MSPRHHPSTPLLVSYAVGELPTAGGLPISAHLEHCATCRATVRAATEQAGAALVEGAEARLSPGLLDAVMARLDEPGAPARQPSRATDELPLPRALAMIGVRRRRWFGVGAWVAHARVSEAYGWKSFILTLPAGGKLPAHSHEGEELIFVLKGRFTDGANWYEAGDIAVGSGEAVHRLQATNDAPCTCLVGLQGALRWRNPATALLKPLTGI